jgi:hypothetical protein
MKRIFWIFCIGVAMALQSPAQSVVRITAVNFTSLPADGDSVTVNGALRTFKTAVTSASDQVAIGASTNLTAVNYAAQLAIYPYTDVSVSVNGGSVYLMGKVNAAMTASMSGAWGSVVVTPQTLTNYTALLPFSSYAPGLRAQMGNYLVDAIANYPTTAIPAGATALSNFVALAAANLMTGANIHSNANQIWISGTITNAKTTNMVFAHALKWMVTQGAYLNGVNLETTNETPQLKFYDTVGGANQKRTLIIPDLNGFNIYFYNDALSAYSNVFSIARDTAYGSPGAQFKTRLTADYIYNTILSNSVSTNMVMLHSTAALIANLMATGPLVISNTAPILTLNETDAGTDLKQFQLRSESGVLTLYMASDAGAVAVNQKVFSVERPGLSDLTSDSLLHVLSPVKFDSTVTLAGGLGLIIGADGKIGGGLVVGSTTETPNGYAIRVLNGGGPIADPATGFGLFSVGTGMKYRTDAAGEGAGQENFVHNRKDEVFGAGTDYTLTGSTAFVDFGTTDPKVTLPTDGTYWVWADVGIATGGTANDNYQAKLRNETASTDLTGASDSINNWGASVNGTIYIHGFVTGTAGNVIAIWSHNNTAARGAVNSARTRIGYIRLY